MATMPADMSVDRRQTNSGSGVECLQFLRHAFSCERGEPDPSTRVVLDYQVVGLYFSASSCPPCQAFTQMLKEAYQEIRHLHGKDSFEVILVPLDAREDAWRKYIERMPWLTLSPLHKEPVLRLFQRFRITEAPRLIMVDRYGQIVADNARGTPGQGFGYGCDPCQAYRYLLGIKPKPPPWSTEFQQTQVPKPKPAKTGKNTGADEEGIGDPGASEAPSSPRGLASPRTVQESG